MCCSVGMADYSTVPPPSSGSAGGGGGGVVNDAFKDALQRARQVSVDRPRGGFPSPTPESRRRGRSGPARTRGCRPRRWRLLTRGPSGSRPSPLSWSEAPPPPTRSPRAWPPLPPRARPRRPVRPACPGSLGSGSARPRRVEGSGRSGHGEGKPGRAGCLASGPRRFPRRRALHPRRN